MITALNVALEIGMFLVFVGLLYCIVQVIEVIREERERLMWIRSERRQPALRQDDETNVSD